MCLGLINYEGKGEVVTQKCDSRPSQQWTFYENGEILNEQMRECLDVSNYEGVGNLQTFPCENTLDQMFQAGETNARGFFSLINYKSSFCLDV